ncbi:MAG: hypothetical protein FVQ82_02655 [Planctomycetes bacterium]|nr:hypothetical protein [Planctomycetota bacterium]
MNKRQTVVLSAGIIIFIVIGLFPPLRRGYGFLLTENSAAIQFQKLLIQWFILSAGVAGLIYYLRGDQKMNQLQYIVVGLAIIVLVFLVIFAAGQPARLPVTRFRY